VYSAIVKAVGRKPDSGSICREGVHSIWFRIHNFLLAFLAKVICSLLVLLTPAKLSDRCVLYGDISDANSLQLFSHACASEYRDFPAPLCRSYVAFTFIPGLCGTWGPGFPGSVRGGAFKVWLSRRLGPFRCWVCLRLLPSQNVANILLPRGCLISGTFNCRNWFTPDTAAETSCLVGLGAGSHHFCRLRWRAGTTWRAKSLLPWQITSGVLFHQRHVDGTQRLRQSSHSTEEVLEV